MIRTLTLCKYTQLKINIKYHGLTGFFDDEWNKAVVDKNDVARFHDFRHVQVIDI